MSLAERGNMYDKELHEVKKKVDKMLAHKTPQYKQGYNKAIDCFVEELKKYTYGRTNGVYVEIPMYKVDELAEQLKME